MAKSWIDEHFAGMVKEHKVDTSGDSSPAPWKFKHSPILGAIDNHQIRAANGRYVGEVYSYADAKLICDLVNAKKAE